LKKEIVPKYLEKEELALLLEISEANGVDHDALIFMILNYTGIKVEELVALKWMDVDFKNHTINIPKTYYNPNNNAIKYQLVTPKTKNYCG
jgi:integrase